MAMAKRFRRQAETCAVLAKQTHDEEGRQRYLRLQETSLQMAETEDRVGVPVNPASRESDIKPAA
jgi:hypothetical protein